MIAFAQRTLLALGLIATLAIPQAQAFEFGVPTEAGNVTVETNQTVNDTFFGAGQDVDIRGLIDGDLLVAGSTVGIHNQVTHNIFAAGQTVRIEAGLIGGILAAGQDVFIEEGTTTVQDVIVAGDTIRIDGNVQGTLRAYGRLVYVNGIINKDAIIHAETITLGSNAIIIGDLTGTFDKPLIKENGARIDGTLGLTKSTQGDRNDRSMPMARGGGLFFGVFATFLVGFVCSLLLATLAPKYVERVRALAQKQTMKALLTGVASVLLVVPLTILLMVLLVTIPVAGFSILVFCLAMMLGHVVSYLYVGDLVGMALAKKHWAAVGSIAAGALVLAIMGYVPLVGMLVVFLATTLGAGTILLDLWDRVAGHTTK